MEVIRGHLGCPLSGGCPLFGGSAIGGSTVYAKNDYRFVVLWLVYAKMVNTHIHILGEYRTAGNGQYTHTHTR